MTYVALSTKNYSQDGYTVFAVGSNKEAVAEAAEREITDNNNGIYADTLIKNLLVVTATNAKKEYGIDVNNAEYMCNNHEDCTWI